MALDVSRQPRLYQDGNMSNDDPQLTTGKIRLLHRLLRVFTPEELEHILESAEVLKVVKWGRITIVFADTHKKTVEVTTSQKLP